MLKLNLISDRGFRVKGAAVLAAWLLAAALLACMPPARADGGQTRTDAKTGLSVTLPAGWVFGSESPDHTFAIERADNKDISGYLTYYTPPDKPETSREHALGLVETVKEFDTKTSTFSEVSDTSMAGLPAAIFTQVDAKETMVEVVMVTSEKEVELTLWAPNDKLGLVLGEFDSIKNSVKIP